MVTSNQASGNGGGLFISDSSATLSTLIVDSNTAAGDGAGLCVLRSVLTLTSSTVSNNAALGHSARGGGISSGDSAMAVRSSAITGNSAEVKALPPTLGESTVSSFRAGDGGGLFIFRLRPPTGDAASDGPCVFVNVTVAGSFASGFGGGLSLWGPAELSLTSSAVSGNLARGSGGGCAAGLGSRLTVTDSSISANAAGVSRALRQAASPSAGAASTAAVEAEGRCAEGELAAPSDGGGVWIGLASSGALVGTTMERNKAEGSGGAAAVEGPAASLLLSSVDVRSNSASTGGGAIAVGGPGARLSASSSLFEDNRAFFGGLLSFRGGADVPGQVALDSLTVQSSLASAGSLFAVLDATTFQVREMLRLGANLADRGARLSSRGHASLSTRRRSSPCRCHYAAIAHFCRSEPKRSPTSRRSAQPPHPSER